MTRIGVVMLLVALFTISLGCSRSESRKRQETLSAEPTAPKSETSQFDSSAPNATLGQRLRKLHEEADKAASLEEKSAAADNLLSLYDSVSHDNSPHVVSVRQDLAARASQLLLDKSPARSKQLAKSGLELSQAPSVLRANLFLVLADAEEALGNKDQAKKALVEALTINEKLFESELKTP